MGKWDVFENEETYFSWIEKVLDGCWRVLKDNGAMYLFVKDGFMSFFMKLLTKHKYHFKNVLIWGKRNPLQNILHTNYNQALEVMVFAIKNKEKKKSTPLIHNNLKQQTIQVPRDISNHDYEINMHNYLLTSICQKPERITIMELEEKSHKTQKPIEVLLKPILVSSNPNSIVLDCCCGVGSIPHASKLLKRNFYACEINPIYHKYADLRLKNELQGFSVSKRTKFVIQRLLALNKKRKPLSEYMGGT